MSVWGAPRKLLSENTMTKLMPRLCQSMRRLATCSLMLRPSTLMITGVADLEADPVGDPLLERDQRRPLIVRLPPFARDQARARRRLLGIGDAAVALQRPGDVGRRPICSAATPFAATMRPRSMGTRSRSARGVLADEGVELSASAVGMSTK